MSEKTKTPILVWVGRVISGLLVLLFANSAYMKFQGGDELAKGMVHLGLPESMVLPLAILEITCVLIYAIPQTAMLGAVLLTGYIGGTICTHWRVGDDFLMQIGIGIFIWLALFFREPRSAHFSRGERGTVLNSMLPYSHLLLRESLAKM